MSSNLKIAQNTASTEANALVGAFTNSSIIKIYDGTQPATPETAVTTQNLLATITLPASPAFGAAANGVITANAISPVTIAASGGLNRMAPRRFAMALSAPPALT